MPGRILVASLAILMFCSVASAMDFDAVIKPEGHFSLNGLKAQSKKAVPAGARMTRAEGGGAAALVEFKADGVEYQFSLSEDTKPQVVDVQEFTYRGRDAMFFHLGSETMAALVVELSRNGSLTITCTRPFGSNGLTRKELLSLADPIDLEALLKDK